MGPPIRRTSAGTGQEPRQLTPQVADHGVKRGQLGNQRAQPLFPRSFHVPEHWLGEEVLGTPEDDIPDTALQPKERLQTR